MSDLVSGSWYEFVAGPGRAVGPGSGRRGSARGVRAAVVGAVRCRRRGRVQAVLRVRAQVNAVLLAAVGEVEARGLARTRGATSTRAWLHGAHQLDPAEASMLVRTAAALRAGFPGDWAGAGRGDISLDQARVVIRSVTDLPADLDRGIVAAAETLMIGHCAVFDPTTLSLIGRRLAECIDPEGTQARDERKHLERE